MTFKTCFYNLIDVEHSLQELQSIRPDPDKPNPKIGVGVCKFNANGSLIASRNGKFFYLKPKYFLLAKHSYHQQIICLIVSGFGIFH